jgi:prolyl oligopeptidase
VVEGEQYPAVLLTTAEGDTRVDPMHARKMTALLQWAVEGDDDARPVLLHQESRAGHGVGKPAGKQADTQADILAFFSWQLD